MNATAVGVVMGLRTKSAGMTPPAGYMGMTHQQYMPQYQRREEFTPEEQELIRRNKGNVIPKIFTSQADSPAVDMASPAWSGIGGALGGAALGGTMMAGTMSPKAMGVGAAAGGVLGAVVGVMKRKAQNASIEENMRRLPPGAVRRDFEADPVYQATQDRNARIHAAMLAGGAAGGVHKFASATELGMDPLRATATGAGVGAAVGGALGFGDPGMMGRGALAGGSVGFLASAVDRVIAKRQQRQRTEKVAVATASSGVAVGADALRRAISRRKLMAGIGAVAGPVIPGVVGYGIGSALGGVSNVGEKDPAVAKARRQRFARVGGLIGATGGAAHGAFVGHMAGSIGVSAASQSALSNRLRSM